MNQDQQNASSAATQQPPKVVKQKKQKQKQVKVSDDKTYVKNNAIPAVNVTMNRNPSGGHEFESEITNLIPMRDGLTRVVIARTQDVAQAMWAQNPTQNFFDRVLNFSLAVKLAYTSEYIDVAGAPIVSLLRKVNINIPDSVKGFVDGIGAFTLEHARFRVQSHLLKMYTHFYRAIGPFIAGFNVAAEFYIPRLNFSARAVRDCLYSQYKRSFGREFNIVVQHNGAQLNLGMMRIPQIDVLNQDFVQYLVHAGFQLNAVQAKLAALVALDTNAIGNVLADADIPILRAAGIEVIDLTRQDTDVAYNEFLNDVFVRDAVISSVYVMTSIQGFEKEGSPGQLLSIGNGVSCPYSLSADDLSYGFMVGANCIDIDYNELQHNINFDTMTANQLLMSFITNDKANGR